MQQCLAIASNRAHAADMIQGKASRMANMHCSALHSNSKQALGVTAANQFLFEDRINFQASLLYVISSNTTF